MTQYKLVVPFLIVVLVSSWGCMMSPLPRAADSGDSKQLNDLLRQGAPVDQRGGSMDETALIIAARHGHLDMVRTLVDAGADINARTKYNDTALTGATAFCHPDVALFLIERGADVNAKNSESAMPPI